MANLERAEEPLRAARLLFEARHWDFAAARAYYATFYAATAALLGEGREYQKHSGVIAAIHKFLVKTGKLDKEHGKNLNWLFEPRSIGDYGDTRHVPREDAARALHWLSHLLRLSKSFCYVQSRKTKQICPPYRLSGLLPGRSRRPTMEDQEVILSQLVTALQEDPGRSEAHGIEVGPLLTINKSGIEAGCASFGKN